MPQIGEQKTFPNGNVAEFDGRGWRLIGKAQTSPPAAAPEGRILSQDTATAEKLQDIGSQTNPLDIGTGVGKGLANTGYGLLNIPGITDGPRPQWIQPTTPGQRAGYAFEQGAEYAIPIPGVGGASLPVKMALEGLRGYGTAKVHGDPDPGIMATIGAAFPIVERSVAAAGRAVADSGEGILRKLIAPDPKKVPAPLPYKPTQANPMEEVAGVRAKNWPEYAQKIQNKVDLLDKQLTDLYAKPVNAAKQVDVATALQTSLAKPQYSATMRQQPALAKRMAGIVDKWTGELMQRSNGTGALSPADARQFKIDMRNVFNDEFNDAPPASVNNLFQSMYKNIDAALDTAVPEGAALNQRVSNAIIMRDEIVKRYNAVENSQAGNVTGRHLRFPVIDTLAAALNTPLVKTNAAAYSPYVGMGLQWLSKFPGRGIFGVMESTEQKNYKDGKKR